MAPISKMPVTDPWILVMRGRAVTSPFIVNLTFIMEINPIFPRRTCILKILPRLTRVGVVALAHLAFAHLAYYIDFEFKLGFKCTVQGIKQDRKSVV